MLTDAALAEEEPGGIRGGIEEEELTGGGWLGGIRGGMDGEKLDDGIRGGIEEVGGGG